MCVVSLGLSRLSFGGWRAVLGALLIAAGADLFGASSVSVVPPDGAPLKSTIGFSFNEKTRQAASGIACATGRARRRCLVVFDEGVKAQFANLGARSLDAAGKPFALAMTDGELDAEGATTDGKYFYVIGSHSVKRKSCEPNAASRNLIRFRARWTSPAAASRRDGELGLQVDGLQQTDGLWKLIMGDPYLARHADGCLGSGEGGTSDQMQRRPGINIEGIAAMEGRLYLGFRGPSKEGVVPVYSVEASALFEKTDAKPELYKLEVGTGLGIRDMVAGKSAMLLLLGPDDHDPVGTSKWLVAEWKHTDRTAVLIRPRVLAALDLTSVRYSGCFKELKPEAISIMRETKKQYRIVVLSDGVCDGGALIFNVPR